VAVDGTPVAGARVSIQTQGDDSTGAMGATDPAGEVELVVPGAGSYAVKASLEGFVAASETVEVQAHGMEGAVTVRLARAVSCAGRVVGLSPREDDGAFTFLVVRAKQGEASSASRIAPPDYAFELQGLGEGEYTAFVFAQGQRGGEQTFVLGPGGDRDLVIEFAPGED